MISLGIKTCTRCGVVKATSEFYFIQSRKRYDSVCKCCKCGLARNYGASHREEIAIRNKESYIKNKSRHQAYAKAYLEKNREYLLMYKLLYRLAFPEKVKEGKDKWKTKNWVKHSRHRCEYQKQKRATDPMCRLRQRISGRIRSALKAKRLYKNNTTMSLVGCSIPELKVHLEKQFKPDMTWNNMGFRGWHIDHIKPCKSFDLSDPAQQRTCFHYTNLQPLWWLENLSKQAKYEQLAPAA
jgi:hypothetical protein